MFKDFNEMPSHSRIWVYQTDKKLSQNQSNIISYRLKNEISEWQSHGNNLVGSYNIYNERFIIIALDESHGTASGCSIDTSVKWLKSLAEELGTDFFDRNLLYFENNELKSTSLFKIKSLIEQEEIKPSTMVTNQNISSKSQLLSEFKIAAYQHPFLKSYFAKEVS